MFRYSFVVLSTLMITTAACQSGRYSSSGFHLPADGSPERGKIAFVSHGCSSCHQVGGVDLPPSSASPAVHVVLGGEVDQRLSDAYLVTSMMDPSYQLAPYPKNQITVDGRSRMPSYVDSMNNRDMIDIVSFLQSRYSIRRYPTHLTYPD